MWRPSPAAVEVQDAIIATLLRVSVLSFAYTRTHGGRCLPLHLLQIPCEPMYLCQPGLGHLALLLPATTWVALEKSAAAVCVFGSQPALGTSKTEAAARRSPALAGPVVSSAPL